MRDVHYLNRCGACAAVIAGLLSASLSLAQDEPQDEPQDAKPVVRALRIGPNLKGVDREAAEPEVEQAAQPTEDDRAEKDQAVAAANPAADARPTKAADGVISLINGNSLRGRLGDTNSAEFLRWQGSDFIEPFEFRTDAIKSIKFPAADKRQAQEGEFAFELLSGDLLSGRLVSWDEEQVGIESPRFGEVHVDADFVRRVYRIDANPTIVFASLSGLQDWNETSWSTDGWQEDGAHLWTEKPDVALNADLNVPERAMIELQVSWTEKPVNFAFAMGVDPEAEKDKRLDGWRLETFDDVLAAVRETETMADVAEVEKLSGNSLRLIAYLDQVHGRLDLYRPDGSFLAKIAVPPSDAEESKPGTGIRLINRVGKLRLERLRISRWSGKIPQQQESGLVNVALADGGVRSGEAISLNADHSLSIRRADDTETVSLDDVVGIKVSKNEQQPALYRSSLFLHDGTRLSGEVAAVKNGRCVLQGAPYLQPVEVPVKLLRTLVVIRREPLPARPSKLRTGRLELGGLRLTGNLVPAIEDDAAGVSCFRWQPFGSSNSSPLAHAAAGRIVYRDPPPPAPPKARQTAQRALQLQQLRLQQQRRGLNFGELFLQKVDRKQPTKARVGRDSHKLHIRSGDVIPCLVQSVNEEGLRVSTASSDDAFVPHEKIKAVELVANSTPPDLEEAKKHRLLTLPRLQKNSPPTHLLCSRNGDFLRCRLLEMSAETLRVELQLEEIEIPRDRVSQIIWFHPEDLIRPKDDGEEKPPQEVDGVSPFVGMAQILKRDGKRVTFNPRQVDEAMISGTNEVLGACRFELAEADQLLFGDGIKRAVSELPYNQWVLENAVEPLMAKVGQGDGKPVVGSESPLIGQEAPEIRLDMLEGGSFVLSQSKGKIVVLDFWATWCGPCMQTMPLVEEAMEDFDPDEVQLVSINLQEPADQVRATMERRDLHVAVALDIDGVAAQRYQARAIPQMVIVDRDGKIARLYVGGGSKTVEEMKAAIQELLDAS